MRLCPRSRLAAGAASALLVLLATRAADAQQAGTVSMNRFDASERGSEWFVGDSLDLRGHVRPAAGIVVDGQYRTLAIYDAGKVDGQILRSVGTVRAGASLVLLDRVRVGFDLPMVVFQDSSTNCAAGECAYGGATYLAPASQALGDLRAGADARLFGQYGDKFQLAAGLQFYFPTGSAADYTSDNTVRFAPRVMAAGDIGPFVYAARVGLMLHRRQVWVADTAWGHEATFSLAAGVRLFDRRLVVGPELWGSTVVTSSPPAENAPSVPSTTGPVAIEGLLGAHYTLGALRFGGGLAAGLTRGLGEPMFRWLIDAEFVMPVARDTEKH